MATFLGLAAAAATLLPMIQSRDQYADEVRRTVRFRRAEAAQRMRHHRETMELREGLFEEESEHTVAQDMQRYRIRLALSRRQSSRDAGIQHFLLNQTTCMVGGLMLGCAFCLIGQGVLPDPSAQEHLREFMMLYAASGGVAIGCLAGSVWCSIKIQRRMTYFDHSAGKSDAFSSSPTATSTIANPLHTMRGEVVQPSHAPFGAAPASITSVPPKSNSGIPQHRSKPLTYDGCRRPHLSLQDYLRCHTEGLRRWATLLLQIGSLAVLIAGWSFASMTLFINDDASRWLLLVLIAVAIIGIVVGDRLFPDETRRDGDEGMKDEEEFADSDRPLQELGMERCLDELLEQEEAQRARELAAS
ncbi:membrane-associated protein, putative [Bodo saltans]|uniref:Membrane-associated protein, putative n=1 Tax=Bodo saltans TaxID=75058 RepID=A0A0S4JDD4_BODSA|nr:membrane-associated protein, putative [Bodo saltans]|eukprot:CUG89587.1 membrane-associated protein, putative [Bodo saltans]